MSQTHARSALALKRIVKLNPSNTAKAIREQLNSTPTERLLATVRGALDNRPQADISNSIFLGRATDAKKETAAPLSSDVASCALSVHQSDPAFTSNPVDDIMQLERELNSMDMALSMGNSIASLDARTNRMKSSMVDGSFMVVPGSSSSIYSPHPSPPRNEYNSGTGTANARARANRVQTILDATTTRPSAATHPLPQTRPIQTSGLESSWFGSNASQMLASSIISAASFGGRNLGEPTGSANSKQLLRLMDSLKTLGDENAALLREVQGAEKARLEAQTAREQMKRFREEYTKKLDVAKQN